MRPDRWLLRSCRPPTAAVVSLLVAACGGTSAAVEVSGSSTVEPISVRVAELFDDAGSEVTVNVDGPGTGDGFVFFCEGVTDISDASRKIKDPEVATCAENRIEWVELQVAFDGLALITNEANDAIECLSLVDLYALVGPESQGFGNWDDAGSLAAELGSTTVFPDAALQIYGPGEESGTFDSFVELALADIAEERGQEPNTRPDYNANADDNVILQGVQSHTSSIGWVGLAFASEAPGVKLLGVDGGDGCVTPDSETVASGAYPLSRPLFIYVNTARAAQTPAIAEYVDFYLDAGVKIAVPEVGYVALSVDQAEAVRAAWEAAR